jgi:hypothetical protein
MKDEIVDLTYAVFKKLLPAELKHKDIYWEAELLSRNTLLSQEEDSIYPMFLLT